MNHVRWHRLLMHTFVLGFFSARVTPVVAAANAGDGIFTNGVIQRFHITIPLEGVTALRTNAREYVPATVREGTNIWKSVGVHLKGSVGSFRGIDGKPGLTLSFEKFASDQRFHGLRKIYLNNSVEDPSYMNELLGNELFRAAGVPAPRVAHALVELNERPLGLYVLKEGFASEFLARYFAHPDGNFYDIAREGHDVNELMQKDFGNGPDDRSDLEAVAEAAVEPDFTRRQQRLQRTLDMDRFLSFMAMEILLGHRDGYCLSRNNFRIYQDVDSGRLVFLPHGMDQLFGNPRAIIQPMMNGLVARAIMEMPAGREAYRNRCATMFTNIFKAAKLNERIDQTVAHLTPALNRVAETALQRETTALKLRIASRIAEVEKQLQQPILQLLRFENNVATPSGWQPVDIPDGGMLVQTNTADGKQALMIRAGPVTSASWRTKVLLPRGRYRFEGLLKTAGIEKLKFGKNHGAVLRVIPVSSTRPPSLLGNQPWQSLQVPFEVNEREQEMELICELRAAKGTAWFDAGSLRLIRLE